MRRFSMNKKKTSNVMVYLAGKVLNSKDASKIQKKLAGSDLSQANPSDQTGVELEDVASNVLNSSQFYLLTGI